MSGSSVRSVYTVIFVNDGCQLQDIVTLYVFVKFHLVSYMSAVTGCIKLLIQGQKSDLYNDSSY